MTRLMTLFVLGMFSACSTSRTLTGELPADAEGAYAQDATGRRMAAEMTGSSFTIDLNPGSPVVVFATRDGVPYTVTFAAGTPAGDTSVIPDFSGTVDLGTITLIEDDGQSGNLAEPEHNPLAEIDSDDDGESDLEDTDDDDDGISDDDDDDGFDDDDSDVDPDDDGADDDQD